MSLWKVNQVFFSNQASGWLYHVNSPAGFQYHDLIIRIVIKKTVIE
jgi:hypothetical protein